MMKSYEVGICVMTAGIILLAAPPVVHAQGFVSTMGDCNVVVECGVESTGLVAKPGGGEQTGMIAVHTYTDFANLDRRCATRAQMELSLQFNSFCRDAQSTPINALIQTTAPYTSVLEQGFARHEIPITHNARDAAVCDARVVMDLMLDNGVTQTILCPNTNHAVYINEASITSSTTKTPPQMMRPGDSPMVALGEFTPLGIAYTNQVSPRASYTITLNESPAPFFAVTGGSRNDARSCQQPLPDELSACSSDQSPVCGCDGVVWSGACEATRAGVAIRSDSPNHPTCHNEIFELQGLAWLPRRPPTIVYGAPEDRPHEVGALMCEASPTPQREFSGIFEEGAYLHRSFLRADLLTPQHLLAWQASLQSVNATHRTSGVLRQDIHKTPAYCMEQDYRLRSCSMMDPCCGQHPDECDAAQSLAAWCLSQGDRDCDGVPDAMEMGSSVQNFDTDGDGLWDRDELELGLDPQTMDSDGDGLSDFDEWQRGLDPLSDDSDGDGLLDNEDAAPQLRDHDRDGLDDGLDPDPGSPDVDGDGLIDGIDPLPFNPDSDSDGLIDGAEVVLGFDPMDAQDASLHELDSDGDGLPDRYEVMLGTDPESVDSDGDGLSDLREVLANTSPQSVDSDMDGLSDFEELFVYFTDPLTLDSDGDGLSDHEEVMRTGSSPMLADSDGDGLSDRQEALQTSSSPLLRDTDGGGFDDRLEWLDAGDPLRADDDAIQYRERHVTSRNSNKSLYFRGDRDVSIEMKTHMRTRKDALEVLSERVVAMPYHQMTNILKMHILQTHDIGEDIIVEVNLDVQGFEVFKGESLGGPISTSGFYTVLWTSEDHMEDRVLVQKLAMEFRLTDPTTGIVRRIRPEELWMNPDIEGPMMLISIPFFEGTYDAKDFITVHLNSTFEVIFKNKSSESCDNGIDDDNNGLTDCDDVQCESECFGDVELCGNGLDDDDNGLWDCEDPACFEQCVDFEVCDDGIDNDGDGRVDLADPYCENFCAMGRCEPMVPVEICDDGFDNDFNGLTDALDPACKLEDCEDGIDNDGDGFTDCLDDKCAMDFFCCNIDDSCGGETCNDGFDNDFDGLIDCDDDECDNTASCMVPGIPPRRSLRDRLGEGCGCASVTTTPAPTLPWSVALCMAGLLGLCVGTRRRRRER